MMSCAVTLPALEVGDGDDEELALGADWLDSEAGSADAPDLSVVSVAAEQRWLREQRLVLGGLGAWISSGSLGFSGRCSSNVHVRVLDKVHSKLSFYPNA